MRGSHHRGDRMGDGCGSIPACAGKPRSVSGADDIDVVHPRVCGEAASKSARFRPSSGPSPRVRGSLVGPEDRDLTGGSIPACAGKPTPARSSLRPDGVHPRVCGEADLLPTVTPMRPGPSPRVRGSPLVRRLPTYSLGSIPACAGKPRMGARGHLDGRVHPRVCGEARSAFSASQCRAGPSPRVRGSLSLVTGAVLRCRSIPACAGKPASSAAS